VVATDASEHGLGVVATKTSADSLLAAGCDPTAARWSTIVSAPWRRSDDEHQHSRSTCALYRRALGPLLPSFCRSSSPRSVRFQVVTFAVSKGRSSSYSLLRRLRYLASLLLASGLLLSVRWIPSAANPADSPSRDV